MSRNRLFVIVLAIGLLLASLAAPALAQQDFTKFCSNQEGYVIAADSDWPASSPCSAQGIWKYDVEGVITPYNSYQELKDANTAQYGTIWFEPAPAGTAQQPTAQPAQQPAETVAEPVEQVVTDHWTRLAQLDPTFRSQGWQAWLRAAGVTWTSIGADARQIEEETSPDSRIYASGIQIKDGVDINIPYPVCVTTDDPSEVTVRADTRQHQPDLRNPSVIYTNVSARGTVTIWVDCSNWGQLTPEGAPPPVEPTEVPATPVPTEAPTEVPPTETPPPTDTSEPEPTATREPEPTPTEKPTDTEEPSATEAPPPPKRQAQAVPWGWVGFVAVLLALALAGAILFPVLLHLGRRLARRAEEREVEETEPEPEPEEPEEAEETPEEPDLVEEIEIEEIPPEEVEPEPELDIQIEEIDPELEEEPPFEEPPAEEVEDAEEA